MVLHLRWLVGFCLASILNFQLCFAEEIAFKKQNIMVNNKKIRVEIAATEAQHAQGLMFRKKLGANEGMLFVFEDESFRGFWMKNTIINLSIGYFDQSKKLVDIQEMKATSMLEKESPPTYPSKAPAKYALEMPEGWFKKNKISEGAILKFEPIK